MEGLPASPAGTVDGSSSGYPSFGDSDDDAGRGVDGLDGAQAKDKQPARFLPAIFIHAGAGFHSHQNERVHLEACEEAAAIGMRALRAGASAVDAVEAALRYLEDKEVTNAGFGSNLSIHGTVECDATIVDHLGRSGACGAVPNIRHPISLAKLILDRSKVPLTLRRVPPNILVGQGACSFAKEHGMPLCSNDALISKNARDRFRRWQEGLHRADARLQWMDSQQRADEVACGVKALEVLPVAPAPPIETMDLEGSTRQGDHVNAISTATWNEGQPDSPAPTSPALCETAQSLSSRNSPSIGPRTIEKRQLSGALDSIWAAAAGREPASKRTKQLRVARSVRMAPTGEIRDNNGDGPGSPRTSVDVVEGVHDDNDMEANINENAKDDYESDEDVINDTIGAIAVDENGHLAAASSSGGIGMKHCGRIGPAALVGVGTAVIPGPGTNPDVSVAAVTSGTGEHMATTMASRRCAERIFGGTRMGLDGLDVAEDDEDAILQSFIRDDFMAHPGVTACHSAGAIGVMVVKRTRRGIYFYFAHNTDSFALASMGADETVPVSVMSRLREGGGSALGGRRIGVVREK